MCCIGGRVKADNSVWSNDLIKFELPPSLKDYYTEEKLRDSMQLKQNTVLHVFQFENTLWQCGEHIIFLTFWKSEILHCNLTIDKVPDVHERISAQAHAQFPYNTWLIFCSFLWVSKVAVFSVQCTIPSCRVAKGLWDPRKTF